MQPNIVVTGDILEQRRLAKQCSNIARRIGNFPSVYTISTGPSGTAPQTALYQGFCYVASGPMVRSSYKAGEYYIKSMIEVDRAASSSSIHHSG
ncbi:hypothetical protein ACET3Z_006120 [Daucus carota]